MNTWRERLQSEAKRFIEWLRKQFDVSQPAASAKPIAASLGVDGPPVPEEKPAVRLAVGQLRIFVNCASCGVLHELEAVCYQCGAPLCSDTLNCRLYQYNPDLNAEVVACPNCSGPNNSVIRYAG